MTDQEKDVKVDLSDPKQRNKYWTKTAENVLLGRRILRVQAMQDDEGNDGGVLTCLVEKGREEVLPVLSIGDE